MATAVTNHLLCPRVCIRNAIYAVDVWYVSARLYISSHSTRCPSWIASAFSRVYYRTYAIPPRGAWRVLAQSTGSTYSQPSEQGQGAETMSPRLWSEWFTFNVEYKSCIQTSRKAIGRFGGQHHVYFQRWARVQSWGSDDCLVYSFGPSFI